MYNIQTSGREMKKKLIHIINTEKAENKEKALIYSKKSKVSKK